MEKEQLALATGSWGNTAQYWVLWSVSRGPSPKSHPSLHVTGLLCACNAPSPTQQVHTLGHSLLKARPQLFWLSVSVCTCPKSARILAQVNENTLGMCYLYKSQLGFWCH